ncbi:MAG TPA: T9SS type A sorting domain-containing protein [Flavobacterium sp.]|jgi:hypothetical protein
MKKLYILSLLVLSSVATFAQTFYSENMGTPAATTPIATNTFQNTTPITYSGTADVRATLVSTGYTGASGGGNVFFTGTAGRYFQIDGLNTAAYATANLQLSFGLNVGGATGATLLVLEQSTNGTTWTPITYTPSVSTGWTLVTVAGGQIMSSPTLSLRWTQPGTVQQRIDDVKLSNVSASCTFAFGTPTTACDAVTSNMDTYTVTLPFTGGGNATYGITTSSGTIGGANPTTTAAGDIVISGVAEGTNIQVTVTGGTCNLSLDVTAPECKPVNALPLKESFNYTAGSSLGAQQMWSNVNSGDNVIIASGNLSYTGITSTGNSASFSGAGIDVRTPFTPTATGTLYASFLMNITDYANVTTDGTQDYFAVLTNDVGDFMARVYLQKAGTQYQIGLTSGTSTTNYTTTLYNVGDVVFVVLGYDFDTDMFKAWINPTVATFTAATPATLTDTPAAPVTNLGGFLFRQGGATSTPSITVDELRIATTINALAVAQNNIAGLSVYPNPVVDGKLFITSSSNESKSVVVYDILGKQVVNTIVTDQAVNVSNLKGGVYIVKITENGNTATRKLIIK